MRSTPARRELGFVLAVAGAGLVAVLAVAFAPWYPADPPLVGELSGDVTHVARLVDEGASLTIVTP